MSTKTCPICSGNGWLVVDIDGSDKLAIERCDNCQLYPVTDNEVVLKVAKLAVHHDKLVTTLKPFAELLEFPEAYSGELAVVTVVVADIIRAKNTLAKGE